MTAPSHNPQLWSQLVHHHSQLQGILQDFLSSNIDRVTILRVALQQGELAAVLYVAQFMSEVELAELFFEWVDLASNAHRHVAAARRIILSLPRDWVISHIEATADSLLQQGTEDEYRRLLELYVQLDWHLTQRLAQRAVQHHDAEIREAGNDFLALLNVK